MTQRQHEQVGQFLKNIKSKLSNDQLGASEDVLGENSDKHAIVSLIEILKANPEAEDCQMKTTNEKAIAKDVPDAALIHDQTKVDSDQLNHDS